MPDRFTLLALSFSLILHNVCSLDVSEPLNPVLNDDDSVSVTCMFYSKEKIGMEAKLMMNNTVVCEIYKTDQQNPQCKWKSSNNGFTFTLKNPGVLHKTEFSCQITRITPLPIRSFLGPKTKLFRGCKTPWAPPKSKCSCFDESHNQEHTVEDKPSPEDMYTFLICGLVIAVTVLCLYSLIITAFYMRLRDATPEPSDNLTYVPMQRNIKWRDPDDTEYVDMREVQKRGGSHRDMNHNSHMMTA